VLGVSAAWHLVALSNHHLLKFGDFFAPHDAHSLVAQYIFQLMQNGRERLALVVWSIVDT